MRGERDRRPIEWIGAGFKSIRCEDTLKVVSIQVDEEMLTQLALLHFTSLHYTSHTISITALRIDTRWYVHYTTLHCNHYTSLAAPHLDEFLHEAALPAGREREVGILELLELALYSHVVPRSQVA